MIPEAYANVKDQVAYCGLKCGECKLGNGTVAESAIDLTSYLNRYDVPSWAGMVPGGKDIDFVVLQEGLTWISKNIGCPGCIKGGGNPECPIRLCAKEKGYASCGKCSDLKTCGKFDWLGEHGKQLKIELAKKK